MMGEEKEEENIHYYLVLYYFYQRPQAIAVSQNKNNTTISNCFCNRREPKNHMYNGQWQYR